MPARPISLAVLGATGAVGRAILDALAERDFPIASLKLLASERSAGTAIDFRGDEERVEEVKDAALRGCELAILATPAAAARIWAAKARAARCAVVDLSAAFRMDPEVPLVVPELNGADVARARGLVAAPGASAAVLALALAPLAEAAGVARASVAALHSASSAGQAAVGQIEAEFHALLNGQEPGAAGRVPHRLAFNLVPQVGELGSDGRAEEEALEPELRRLLGERAPRIAATAVHVPIFYGLALSVNLATRRKLAADEARLLLRKAPGVKVVDDPGEGIYPMSMLAVNEESVLAGRIRDDPTQENGLELFLAADNLRRAAANAVGIAERLRDQRG